MKKCPKCGSSFEDTYNICTSCGTPLEKVPGLKGRMGGKTIGEAAAAASPKDVVHTASKLKGKMGGKAFGESTPHVPGTHTEWKPETNPGPKAQTGTKPENVVVSGKLKGKVGHTEFHTETVRKEASGGPVSHDTTSEEEKKYGGPVKDVSKDAGSAYVPVVEPSSESRTSNRKWIPIVLGIAAALVLTILTAVIISVVRKEKKGSDYEPTRAASNEPTRKSSDDSTRRPTDPSDSWTSAPTTTTATPTTTTVAPTTTTVPPTTTTVAPTTTTKAPTTTVAPVLSDGQYYGEITSYDSRTITFRMLLYWVFSPDAGNMIWDYTGEVKTLDYTNASVRLEEVYGYQLSDSWRGGEVQCASLEDAFRKMDSVGGNSPFVYFVVRNGVISDLVFQYVA